MKFTRVHGLVVLRARVGGPAGYRSAVLAVDMGAAQTLLHPDVIRAIGATDEVDRIPLNTVSDVIQAPRMRVENSTRLGL
jgi:hypothetical protein